jgi:hypothetical protein
MTVVVIDYTLRAVAHLTALLDSYEEKERPDGNGGLQRMRQNTVARLAEISC